MQLGMLHGWDETYQYPTLHPKCESVNSKRAPLHPISMEGWELVNRNDKKSFEATKPGSQIVRTLSDFAGHA